MSLHEATTNRTLVLVTKEEIPFWAWVAIAILIMLLCFCCCRICYFRSCFVREKDRSAVLPCEISVPDKPIGLVATSVGFSVILEWLAPESNGGAEIDYYIAKLDQDDSSLLISGNTAIFERLAGGKQYKFSVCAHNAFGKSALALFNEVVVHKYPGKPTCVLAVPNASNTSASVMTVSWKAPADSAGSEIDFYTARATPGGSVVQATLNSVVFTGLSSAVSYVFVVTAHNKAGDGPPSDPSSPVQPTPGGNRINQSTVVVETGIEVDRKYNEVTVPGPPQNVSAVVVAQNKDNAVTISFRPPLVEGSGQIIRYTAYSIPEGHIAIAREQSMTEVTIRELWPGSAYKFVVTAHNEVGEGPPSQPSETVRVLGKETNSASTTATALGEMAVLDMMQLLQEAVLVKLGGEMKYVELNLKIRRIHLKKVVNFWAGTAIIKPEGALIVEELAKVCKAIFDCVRELKMEKLHMRVEGHVHKTQDRSKCWTLSGDRAKIITEMLKLAGCPDGNVHPRGYGYSRPLGTPNTDRRVEVHIMGPEELRKFFSNEEEEEDRLLQEEILGTMFAPKQGPDLVMQASTKMLSRVSSRKFQSIREQRLGGSVHGGCGLGTGTETVETVVVGTVETVSVVEINTTESIEISTGGTCQVEEL
jgi:outer membrane protein OmpA-like peptidoglycan-associated protein